MLEDTEIIELYNSRNEDAIPHMYITEEKVAEFFEKCNIEVDKIKVKIKYIDNIISSFDYD